MTGIKTQNPRGSGGPDSPSRDDVLKRMLKMKPKLHKVQPKSGVAEKTHPKRDVKPV